MIILNAVPIPCSRGGGGGGGGGGGVPLFWCDTLAEATGMVLTHAAASYLLDVRG